MLNSYIHTELIYTLSHKIITLVEFYYTNLMNKSIIVKCRKEY